MKRRTFLTLAIGTLALAVVPATFAADKKRDGEKKEGEWERLGEAKVGKREERDVIEVNSPYRFTTISFKVERGDVDINDIKVTFDDDTTFSVETNLVFREGERSRKIDLPGKSRAIKRVRFLYRAVGRDASAVIELDGKVGK